MSNSSDANSQIGSKPNQVNLESTPNSSNPELSRDNNLNTTNRTGLSSYNSSYSPYGGGYGGYSSSYGSGYGSYGGYGGGYSGYGGYNSGYGSYGSYGSNQYSNTYSKPIPQNANEQVPPPTMRNDVWGFLNGFHAILHVLYAATGIVHFGKMFLKMSVKIIKNIFGKSAGLFFRLTGFAFLKRIMLRFSSDINWQSEFSLQDAPLENIWGGQAEGNINRTFFGKFRLVLQICSLMGALISYFLRRKISNQPPPSALNVDATVAGSGEAIEKYKAKQVELADIEKFYDGIRLIQKDSETPRYYPEADLIEEECQNEEDQIEAGLKEFNSYIKEDDEKSKISKEDIKSNSDVDFDALESQLFMEEKEQEVTIVDETKEQKEIISSEENKEEAVQFMPTQVLQQVSVVENEYSIIENKERNTEAVLPKKQLYSEDFWGNSSPTNNEEAVTQKSEPAEETKKTFELPSVLQMLRANSTPSNKPWFLKKKASTIEPKAEEVVQSSVQNKVETVEETPKPSEIITETVQAESNVEKTIEITA